MKSAQGSAIVYTRHMKMCPHVQASDYNRCNCPKWLYTNISGKRTRRSLNTPSFAEAQRIAADLLRGLDPEIAEARAITEKHQAEKMPVADACELWIERTRREYGEGGTVGHYQSLMRKLIDWTSATGIEFVQDITSLQLERWYSSSSWKHYSATTRHQRWGVLRSVFNFLLGRGVLDKNPIAGIKPSKRQAGHVQGPYSDEQVERILAAIDGTAAVTVSREEIPHYTKRLRAMIGLLLASGCDVIDAVLFRQENIETMKVGSKVVHVLRYEREKTGVEAIVPIPKQTAIALRDVPILSVNPDGMPFRSNTKLESDSSLWSRRIRRVLKAAGVDFVELPMKDKRGRPVLKAANAKQFRHTAAVRWLRQGQRVEEVGRMLGHVNTDMVRLHYSPWVASLDEAHVKRVIEAFGR